MKQYRMIRVIEYVGDEEFINEHRTMRGVKGTRLCRGGIIREAILGDTDEILDTQETENTEGGE